MKGAAAGLSGMVALALPLPMEAGVPIPLPGDGMSNPRPNQSCGVNAPTGCVRCNRGQRGSQMTTGMSRSVRRW